jgi:hypothetical protein
MALFLVLALIAACAARSRAPARAEFLLSSAAAALALAGVALLVFSEVAFQGWQARGVAAALGMAIAAAAAGVGLRIWRPHRRPEGGLAVALAVFSPAALTAPGFLARLRGRRPTGRPSPPPETAAPTVASWRGAPLRVAALVVLAAAAWLLSSRTALVDWNFVLRKLGVLAVWTATFGVFLEAANRGARRWAGQSALMLAAALLVLGAHQGFARWQRAGGGARDAMLEAYSAHNVSFRLLDDALRIPSLGAPFYRFLGENTNLPPATRVQPVDVKLVDRLEPSGRPRPNIFVFLLDSLRRDYLSPYNPAVAFTPRIEAFARESVVLQNAFTRYGGTGLSEPALWTGGLVLHKQYVTPYHPMNALQKLLDADRYRLYLTRGEILDTLLGPSSEVVRLSKDVPEMDFDLCTVTAELEQRLTESAEPGRPVFAYSLPQNLHVAAINREGQSVPAGESYPGFHAPYAARVRRIDACFGRFIDFLKRTGLYDDSIVVLSTDHGDMLGEDGKWGHAYTLSPEVLEIPLILRVPAALTRGLDLDTRTIAFLSDLTPTLYYLLGHRPILRSDVTGRPLFTESAEERNVYLQPSYLVASSYGPVYGLLRNNGTSLYVVDGINFNDRLYDLSRRSPENRQPVTEAMRSESQRLIRDHILELGRFYGFWHPR